MSKQGGGESLAKLRLIQVVAAMRGCLTRAQAEARLTSSARVLGSTPEWDPTAVKAFIGVSGAYDVFALADHLDRRRVLVRVRVYDRGQGAHPTRTGWVHSQGFGLHCRVLHSFAVSVAARLHRLQADRQCILSHQRRRPVACDYTAKIAVRLTTLVCWPLWAQ